MYDGIIFDQDGVLLDSGINKFRWMDKIRAEEAQKQGFQLEPEEIREIVKASSHKEVKKIIDRKGMDWEHLRRLEKIKEDHKIERIEHGDIKLFPQVKEILGALDIPKAVVTNAPRISTDFTVNYFGIEKHFESVKAPGLEDMKRFYDMKKPKPVMIKEALDETGMENPLMIGDTGADIKAAENIGIDSLHINSYGFGTGTEPTYEADNLQKILEIVNQ